jgi:hypothetical protein
MAAETRGILEVDVAWCWRTARRREELPGEAVGREREREAWPENDGVLFVFSGWIDGSTFVCPCGRWARR